MAKTIIICDNDKEIIASVGSMLKKNGYNVVSCSTGDECLKKIITVKPDLVLIDVMMPGRPVRDIVQEIGKKSKTKVAYLTMVKIAKAEVQEILKHNNISDFIQKPIDDKEFSARIKKIFA